jgi:hypothetical protein
MRVVDSEHASPGRIVQGQRIAHAMRPVLITWNTLRHDLHPKTSADLGEEAVEIEEPIETLVAPAHAIDVITR